MNIFDQFLLSVLRATKEKRLTWTKTDYGEWAASGKVSVIIRQVVPLVAGPTETIGPQAFEVEAAGVCFAVWDGCESSHMVRDILSAGLSDWSSHRQLTAEKLANAVTMLNSNDL
jgi:hypothetical protein